MSPTLFTIGHSNHTTEHLKDLLKRHAITTVYDIRSQPYSRYNPQFNRETLQTFLSANGVGYVFLGEQLGARSKNPAHYLNDKVRYEAIAVSNEFEDGLERVRKGIETGKVALLCAEKDPMNCHRAILVCRHLRHESIEIQHTYSRRWLPRGHLRT